MARTHLSKHQSLPFHSFPILQNAKYKSKDFAMYQCCIIRVEGAGNCRTSSHKVSRIVRLLGNDASFQILPNSHLILPFYAIWSCYWQRRSPSHKHTQTNRTWCLEFLTIRRLRARLTLTTLRYGERKFILMRLAICSKNLWTLVTLVILSGFIIYLLLSIDF
jgi:hypothetical protein